MLSLALTVVCAVSIAALLRYNEQRGGDRFVVAGTNYITATLLGLTLSGVGDGYTPSLLLFGVLVGVGFVAGFVVMMRAMELTGMAVPATASRLSTLMPVLGAMIVYNEVPTGWQWAGIAVGLVAFGLLGAAQRANGNGGGRSGINRAALLALTGVFLVSGIVDFSMKVAETSGAAQGPYLPIVFGTAGVISFAVVAARRRQVRLGDVLLGLVLGIPNFFASFFILRALDALPTVVVFPVMNAAVVIGVTLTAFALWREVPHGLTIAGLVLAAVAVLLLGMG